MKIILLQALGYTFLVLGVFGLFLPILQGFLFMLIGLIILARHAAWAERLLEHFLAPASQGGRADRPGRHQGRGEGAPME